MRPGFFKVAAIAALSAACTHRAYEGPERSAEELSSLSLAREGEITYEGVRIDERPVGHFADSVDVLPGEHAFQIKYRMEYSTPCDTRNYLCDVEVSYGVCNGSIRTKPGRKYLLTLSTDRGGELRVSAKGYFDFFERDDEPNVGHAVCETTSSYDPLGW